MARGREQRRASRGGAFLPSSITSGRLCSSAGARARGRAGARVHVSAVAANLVPLAVEGRAKVARHGGGGVPAAGGRLREQPAHDGEGRSGLRERGGWKGGRHGLCLCGPCPERGLGSADREPESQKGKSKPFLKFHVLRVNLIFCFFQFVRRFAMMAGTGAEHRRGHAAACAQPARGCGQQMGAGMPC